MSLTEYRRKRNFQKSPEPKGNRRAASQDLLSFVVQKHHASRLHYDFRLELDGVLKSWAVPKGPSLDPIDRQLAVQVEDHPVEYGDFEGTIPKGEYGGGTVMLWDRGTWQPVGDPSSGLKKGKLKFDLYGTKLNGRWNLVRMSGDAGDDGNNWLLIKEQDDEAHAREDYDITAEEPLSILSGRDLAEIAEKSDDIWTKDSGKTTRRQNGRAKPVSSRGVDDEIRNAISQLEDAREAKQPKTLKPQLATLASEAPEGEEWLHEMKFDGYRLIAILDQGHVKLLTRNSKDWTKKFPGLVSALERCGLEQGIFDGELVVLRRDGTSDFQRLQNSIKSGKPDDFVYYVFDLPYCLGYDLTNVPLIDRKEILQRILVPKGSENDGMVRYSDHIIGNGSRVISNGCQHQLEGIICKRANSVYEQRRSRSWLKVKCLKRQEFVIGGWTWPSGSRTGFGSLLIGHYRDGDLIYAGRVGTGFTNESLDEVSAQLHRQHVRDSPFASLPSDVEREVAGFTKPKLVAEVEFTEWTRDGVLRHPSFKGLREDKPATQIHREDPMPTKDTTRHEFASASANGTAEKTASRRKRSGKDAVSVAGISISSPDRVIDPESGLTKRQLAEFYEDIQDWILPHLIDRPLSLLRCPQGNEKDCFFQKHFDLKLPDSVRKVPIKEKNKTDDYVAITDLSGLVALVQYGVLEIHPWGSRIDNLEKPDRIVFDLDPGEGTDWTDVVVAAGEVRERLSDLGLESFLRTSGGKGLHVVVPLVRRRGWEGIKEFAHGIATAMASDEPAKYVDTMSKHRRKGRIFVDYLRNGRGATAVASYSTRARKGGPVATPLAWDELDNDLRADKYTVENLRQRLESLKSDPWEGFFQTRQSVTQAMMKAMT